MPSTLARGIAGIIALIIFGACSPQAPRSRLVGAWGFQSNGMNWEWVLDQDGSLKWMILGQSDMSGKVVDISGGGNYSFDGGVLLLRLDKFAGLPGMWRSADAAPGFDPSTKVTLRFLGKDSMQWSFTTQALGAQEVKATRLR
jgi:hypothetical protein